MACCDPAAGLDASFPGAVITTDRDQRPEHGDNLKVGTNSDPYEFVDDWGISAEANWDLDVVKLKSILAYRNSDIARGQDIDFTNVYVLAPGNTDERWENWSLEFQAGGTVEALLNVDWLLGWYGYSEDLRNASEVKIASAAGRYIELQVYRAGVPTVFDFESRFNSGEGR